MGGGVCEESRSGMMNLGWRCNGWVSVYSIVSLRCREVGVLLL